MMVVERLYGFWTAVWPNLAANVVWIPVVGAHHWWTRHKMTVLHDTIRELHALLGETPHVTEQRMTTVNWGKVFRSPQAIISLLTAAVTAAGTAGLIDTNLSGAIQTLLVAILGVASAVTHTVATARLNQRTVRQLLEKAVDE